MKIKQAVLRSRCSSPHFPLLAIAMSQHARANSVTPDYVPQPLDVGDVRSLPLTPRDAYLMTLIDGETTVADLAAMMGEVPSEVVRRWLRLETMARQAVEGVQNQQSDSGVFKATLVDGADSPLDQTAPWRLRAQNATDVSSRQTIPDSTPPVTIVDGQPSHLPPPADPQAALSNARELARGARAAELEERWLEAVNLWRLALELHDSAEMRAEHARADLRLREYLAEQALLDSQVTLVDS